MSHEHPKTRPGVAAGRRARRPSADTSSCDPLALLAAEIAASAELVAHMDPDIVATKFGGGDPDAEITSSQELEGAEDTRIRALESLAPTLCARSNLGALLQALMALEQAEHLDEAARDGDRIKAARHRRPLIMMLYSIAYYLAGPEPDKAATVLLERYAPRGFHAAEQLERLRAA